MDEPEEVARFTRWETNADGSRRGVSSFQLSGMHCAACAGIIENALAALDGVHEVRVSASAQRATVHWDPTRTRPSRLVEAVQRAGYEAAPDAALAARDLRQQEHRHTLWRLFVAGFLAMQVMMMATPSYVAAPGELSHDLRQLLNWGSWILSVPVLWFAGMPFLRGAWVSLRTRRIGMDVPVALGLLVTFVASTAATFDPGGPFGEEVYFDSLTMFLAFLWLGRFLEMRSRHRAAERLESTAGAMPQTAWRVAEDGSTLQVSLHRLAVGDRVRVTRGGVVPADGELLADGADVSEALITGESAAVLRRRGEDLWAGSLNLGAPFDMRVVRLGADTRHDAIVALMREALSSRPASVRLADRWAGPFLWAVLALAALAGLAWWFIEPARALWVVVSVLIVTCPCALSLATPSTLVAAAGGLARKGVLLRRLDTLEAMSSVQTIFLDKTGTLTEGRLQLRRVKLLDTRTVATEAQALMLAAGLAQWSAHPLSRALAEAYTLDHTPDRAFEPAHEPHADPAGLATWQGVSETPGAGLQAMDAQGRRWRLGSLAWAVEEGGPEDDDVNGHGVVLSCGGRPVAAFSFEEYMRGGAQDAVSRLAGAGLRLALLSGDSTVRAKVLAQRLGLQECHAGLSPEDKLSLLRQAQARGLRSAMVGDGLNDAPVLAAADVSVAMGHGALVAREGADAVIVSGRLDALADFHHTAQRTMAIVRQNLTWAVAYNAICIPLALTGWLPPWAAGLGMAASSLLVMLNAQRAGS
ncbi:MAG: cation-translocating P-type ATPase [Betaproteobacteria bacterium]